MSESTTTTVAQDTASLTGAIIAFMGDTLDATGLQAIYRDVHASRRGTVQSGAIMGAMADPSFDAGKLPAVLDAFANLPTVSSRTSVRKLTDDETDAIRTLLTHGIDAVGKAVLSGAYGDDVDPFVFDQFVASGEKVIGQIDRLSIGNSRTQHDDTPTSVTGGSVTLSARFRDNDVTATLNDDNSVTLDDDTFPSISAAAKAVCGRPQNGWTFWRHNGATLASLRDQ